MKGEKLEMSVKERLYQALKNRNFFDSKEKEYLDVLKNTQELQDVILHVERGCNVDQLYFRYNPTTDKFDRVVLTSKDYDQLEKEAKYQRMHDKCIKSQCFQREITIDAFVELLKLQFEPIAIYLISQPII